MSEYIALWRIEWQTHDDGSKEILSHNANVITLGHVVALLFSINIQSKQI